MARTKSWSLYGMSGSKISAVCFGNNGLMVLSVALVANAWGPIGMSVEMVWA